MGAEIGRDARGPLVLLEAGPREAPQRFWGAALCECSSLTRIPSWVPSLGMPRPRRVRTQLGDRIWQQPTNSVVAWEARGGMMTGTGQTSPGMVFHLCHRFLRNAEQAVRPPSFIFTLLCKSSWSRGPAHCSPAIKTIFNGSFRWFFYFFGWCSKTKDQLARGKKKSLLIKYFWMKYTQTRR